MSEILFQGSRKFHLGAGSRVGPVRRTGPAYLPRHFARLTSPLPQRALTLLHLLLRTVPLVPKQENKDILGLMSLI